MAQTIEQLIEFIATTETPKSVTNPIVAEALSLLLGKTYRLFDGDKVNNIVQEGGFSDVFVVNGQTVDPRPGDLLYNAEGTYGRWGIITDVHLEGQQLYVTYVWDGKINTIMIDENGDAARYVNRYKTPKVYDAQSVLSASSAGNMQDYFLIMDPDNPTQSYFEFWQVGDLIGSPKGGIIVGDVVNPGGLDNTMMYIYGGEIVTITYKAQSPAKILSVSKARIGSPNDEADDNGSLFARIAWLKDNGSGNVILQWDTDVATTRKQVTQSARKSGLQISYKHPENGWTNEQFVGTNVSDTEWVKDNYWKRLNNDNFFLLGNPKLGGIIEGVETNFEFDKMSIFQYMNRTTTSEYKSSLISFYVFILGEKHTFSYGVTEENVKKGREVITLKSSINNDLSMTVYMNWGALQEVSYALIEEEINLNKSLIHIDYGLVFTPVLTEINEKFDAISNVVYDFKGLIEL